MIQSRFTVDNHKDPKGIATIASANLCMISSDGKWPLHQSRLSAGIINARLTDTDTQAYSAKLHRQHLPTLYYMMSSMTLLLSRIVFHGMTCLKEREMQSKIMLRE